MSHYSSSGRKPQSKSRYKSSDTKRGNKGGGGRSFGPSRRGGSGRSRSSGRSAQANRKFDPSMFIKKVEETQASAIYNPKHMFSDFAIAVQIKKNISEKGYTMPTPIQDQVIPLILEGKDVIATANTGTGKTASFLIPLVNNVLTKKTDRVLIIAPTRELADQIRSELNIFKKQTGLSSMLCIGGVNINTQINDLKRNPHFVIGTPGRLIDLEQNRSIHFDKFTSIVLDEVDRMLDMGFIRDIKYIINKLPAKRHSLFFSATIPTTLKSIMDGFLRNPVSVSVKSRQSAENVNQDVIKIGQSNKIEVLHDLLIKPEFKKVIIFLRTKWAVDRLAKELTARGFGVATIHGNKTQSQRKKALASFKDDQVTILLATDVVARGIDIDDVSHVINFDLPQTYEDYIHRVGRTGRAEKVGQAITFID